METIENRKSSIVELQHELRMAHPAAELLLGRPVEEQQRLGYYNTLQEICHQPVTWRATCEDLLSAIEIPTRCLEGANQILITGSGSSEYAGECARMALQNELGIPCTVLGGGTLLAYGKEALPPLRPALMVSLARSGDSPESVAALALMLQQVPEMRHLALVCNAKGRLASEFRHYPQVCVLVLDDMTNDRSLVMTSSFTNLVLAARFLGMLHRPDAYQAVCRKLSGIAERFLLEHFGKLAKAGALPFQRVIYLANGGNCGAARESALKMLESTAGQVPTMSETYLGFRHGPMSLAHQDTLLVCFLSSNPTLRAYEDDLLRELNEKKLGMMKIVLGEDIPQELMNPEDVSLECKGLREAGDSNAPVIHVMAGQLLAFFRSLQDGLKPDSPSDGTINRVVQGFTIHTPGL